MDCFITQEIEKTQSMLTMLGKNAQLLQRIYNCAEVVCDALRKGNKVLLAGNGGSAADAQHIAGEFVSRFYYDRPGLPAFALTVDTSVLTAIGNDYGYENVFARQVQTVGQAGDIFWAYSTSGKSPNVLKAMKEARIKGMSVIGFTGQAGWSTPELCDILIDIPSTETPKIQEGHLIVGHIVCGLVEANMFPRTN